MIVYKEGELFVPRDQVELVHYGTPRHSGRYPWGSGENPYQRRVNMMSEVEKFRKEGLTNAQIAEAMGFRTVTELRQHISVAKSEIRAANVARAIHLRYERQMSGSEVARAMGINESAVRSLLDMEIHKRQSVLKNITDMIRNEVDTKTYVDIGGGTDTHLGVSRDKLLTAVSVLESEGYQRWWVETPQLHTGLPTTVMVMAKPDAEYPKLMEDPSQIKLMGSYTPDKGVTIETMQPPRAIPADQVQVVYGSEGGADKDGLIELRPGIPEIDLGPANYAQVRMLVEGDRYLKGVAVMNPDLPEGVNVRFNSNKEPTGNPLDAMKKIEDDPNNPFGTSIKRQKKFTNAKGETELSALNIVYEEGDWWNWAHNFSSQMLSKQPPPLARDQLKMTRDNLTAEFEEIKALTNPTLRQTLLQEFSDKVDSDAVDLAAMGLPRTRNHVIIPDPNMKDNEVYAPNFKNGETVVLIRHPHGGIFEIPELTVNNKVKSAQSIIGKQPRDAVVINSKVAQQLSGADFDGDTVLVVPNPQGAIKTAKPLKALEGFDPQTHYPGYEGMKVMRNTQTEMGRISNLITDMSVHGAPDHELARAVKHSMVVIDAEKHELNYKQSEEDNRIKELRAKYQVGGASTLISRASSDIRVQQRTARRVADGGPIDKVTGELKFTPRKDSSFTINQVNKRTGEVVEKTIIKTEGSTRMREASDARTLMSSPQGRVIERVYADHANALKQLANQARLEMIKTPNLTYSRSAATAYKTEADSLKAKLSLARMNAPLERQAQLVAAAKVRMRQADNPDMTPDQVKKAKTQELDNARAAVGAGKQKIPITPREWEAIQAGAIAHTPLTQILNNTDPKVVREYATPREFQGLTPAKASRARSMLGLDYTQAEIAEVLGVSVSTVQQLLKEA